jgi:hypothetical protein
MTVLGRGRMLSFQAFPFSRRPFWLSSRIRLRRLLISPQQVAAYVS